MFPTPGSAMHADNGGIATALTDATGTGGEGDHTGNSNLIDPLFILEKNRLRIAALRAAIVELESRVNMQKSYSREVLPPMDGVTPNDQRPATGEGNTANIGVADMYSSVDMT